jgi:hypothetical protein
MRLLSTRLAKTDGRQVPWAPKKDCEFCAKPRPIVGLRCQAMNLGAWRMERHTARPLPMQNKREKTTPCSSRLRKTGHLWCFFFAYNLQSFPSSATVCRNARRVVYLDAVSNGGVNNWSCSNQEIRSDSRFWFAYLPVPCGLRKGLWIKGEKRGEGVPFRSCRRIEGRRLLSQGKALYRHSYDSHQCWLFRNSICCRSFRSTRVF